MHPHHRRDLETRLSDASRKLLVAAPREELENERAKLEALQRAYRSAADQARAPPHTPTCRVFFLTLTPARPLRDASGTRQGRPYVSSAALPIATPHNRFPACGWPWCASQQGG